MTNLKIKSEPTPLTINLSSVTTQTTMTTEQFYAFCRDNQALRIERTADGEVVVTSPAFSDTGNRNFKIAVQLGIWAEQDATGEGVDSSAGFTLPNGALQSPDASWIKRERWNALSARQKASFAPICPDFVIELKSASDTLLSLQQRMQEYIENGVVLGVLIDRKKRTVHLYRPSCSPEILENPNKVNCNPELPSFELRMGSIW